MTTAAQRFPTFDCPFDGCGRSFVETSQLNDHVARHRAPEKTTQSRTEYMREYDQRPEVKAKRREYHQRPEVKAHQREYQREYYQRREAGLAKEGASR